MEKYRKFDDARNGVNPFVPAKIAKSSPMSTIAKTICSCGLLLLKIPFVLLILLLLLVSHLCKYLLVVPALIRFNERLIDMFLVKALMQAFALMQSNEVFHKEDSEFDFVKAKTGKLVVNRGKHISTADPTLLLANDTCVLEYLWLQGTFSPLFAMMDFDENTGKAGLRAIGRFEILQRACGINFPGRINGNLLYKSFRELREAQYVQVRPIVFFPECTRSNGKGVLEFPKEAVEMIEKALQTDKFKVHALRFDYNQSSASYQPYNSTDISGWKHALVMLSQFVNNVKVQYMFNLQNDKSIAGVKGNDLHLKLKEALFSPGHEYNLDKSWHDHQEFLKCQTEDK